MKVFIAGAGGAIGQALVPAMVAAEYQVTGMTRSPGKADAIRAAGADAVIADALDREAVISAVRKAAPDVIVHELTAIPGNLDLRHFDRDFALTNRLRTEGTDHLLEAAEAAGVRHFVAQSFGGWPYARQGGPIKDEDDPLDPHPPAGLRRTFDAIRYLESRVLGAPHLTGAVLRYAGFYGPGTSIAPGGSMAEAVRRRHVPIIGKGTGIWSFIHIADAAAATVAAVNRRAAGVFNIADDQPAAVREWLPALASAIGAAPPRHIPAWLGRLIVGEHGVVLMNEIRGASNRKAKGELGWKLAWPTWRDGFASGLAWRLHA